VVRILVFVFILNYFTLFIYEQLYILCFHLKLKKKKIFVLLKMFSSGWVNYSVILILVIGTSQDSRIFYFQQYYFLKFA